MIEIQKEEHKLLVSKNTYEMMFKKMGYKTTEEIEKEKKMSKNLEDIKPSKK